MKNKTKIKRIGIDARFFGPKDKGFGRYTENLIRNLEDIDFKNKYFIFLREDSYKEYQPRNRNFKKVLADYKWYSLKEQIFLPLKLKKYKLDLVHFTHFNVPILYKQKFVVTIHDLTLRKFPTTKKSFKNFFTYPFKKLGYKIVFSRAVKKAEKIIAISNYTKQEILKYYNIEPEKIQVIYEGAYSQIKEGKKDELVDLERTKTLSSKIKKPYLLYVGNAYPHKNLKRLILAFKRVIKIFPDLYLILAGGDDYFYRKLKLEIKKQNPEIKNRVIFPGFISENDLDVLYRNAVLYVFPSLNEGFGLPPIEAMSRGVPVVSSKASCLPEVLGGAALYFNPLEVDDIAEKIKKVLSNKDLRKGLIEKGFKQIKKYSWQKMARETGGLYKAVLN